MNKTLKITYADVYDAVESFFGREQVEEALCQMLVDTGETEWEDPNDVDGFLMTFDLTDRANPVRLEWKEPEPQEDDDEAADD